MSDGRPLAKVRPSCGIVDGDPLNWVCHRYVSFTTSSVPFMVDVLAAVEPISMSKVALRAVSSKGKKDAKMKALAELLEFSTGVSRETRLVGKLRHIPTLKEWLRQQSHAEGRRARDLPIPPQWSATQDGVYRFVEDSESLWVLDRISGVQHEILADEMLKFRDGCVIPMEKLEIHWNYSAEKQWWPRLAQLTLSTSSHSVTSVAKELAWRSGC